MMTEFVRPPRLLIFTRAQKRAEALREILLRRHVHRGAIERGWLTEAQAERQIAIMEAIAEDYAEPDLFGEREG